VLDIQFAFPQEMIPVSSAKLVYGPPLTVDIIGEDFRLVDQVLINDVPSPDVVIVSQRRLLAQVPPIMVRQRITSVTISSASISLSSKNMIKFKIGDAARKASGIMRLMQTWLKMFFTTQGTSISNKSIGGGAQMVYGQSFGQNEIGNIISGMVIAADTTTRQLIAVQSRVPKLPLTERLLSGKVINAGFNRNETALAMGIELVSQSGKTGQANMEL